MFPSRYISYRDLEPGKSYTGTIQSVQIEQARASFTQGTQSNRKIESDWVVYFKEWNKPFKLKKTKAAVLAAIFGEKNTDRWGGKVVTFYRGKINIGDEVKDCISIDDRPPLITTAALAPAASQGHLPAPPRAPLLLDASRAKTIVPLAHIDRFKARLADYEKTWGDFLMWLKQSSPDGHALVIGHALDDISGGVLPAMGRYLEILAKPPEPEEHQTQPNTGTEPIREEDIPF